LKAPKKTYTIIYIAYLYIVTKSRKRNFFTNVYHYPNKIKILTHKMLYFLNGLAQLSFLELFIINCGEIKMHFSHPMFLGRLSSSLILQVALTFARN
jgi:hypothetical protein